MRWLTIAVALAALVLVGAGCGGGDEASSDTTALTETTTDETTTDETTTEETTTEETTTEETTTDSDDPVSLASGECAELIQMGTQLSQTLGAAGTSGDSDDVSAFFDEFAAKAPEEIRADFQVLADAWEGYAEVLADVQVEPGKTPDAEALAKLQQALASIDQQEVSAASQRISDWAAANCPTG